MQNVIGEIWLWFQDGQAHARLRTNVSTERVRLLLGELAASLEVIRAYGHPVNGQRPGVYLRFRPEVSLAQIRGALSIPGENDDR